MCFKWNSFAFNTLRYSAPYNDNYSQPRSLFWLETHIRFGHELVEQDTIQHVGLLKHKSIPCRDEVWWCVLTCNTNAALSSSLASTQAKNKRELVVEGLIGDCFRYSSIGSRGLPALMHSTSMVLSTG